MTAGASEAPTVPDGSAPVGKVGRSSAFYLLASALQLLGSLLLLPLLARRLDVAELGSISTALLVTQLLALVLGLGLPAAAGREYFDDVDLARRIVWAAAPVVGLGVLVAHLAGPWWAPLFRSTGYDGALVLAVATAWPRAVALSALALHRSAGRAVVFGTATLGLSILATAGGLVALSATGRSDARTFLAGVLVVQSLTAVLSLAAAGRPVLRGGLPLAALLGYSLPMLIHSAAGLVVTTGDRVLVEHSLGLEAVGGYHVAYSLGAVGLVGLLAVNNAWSPMIVGAPEPERPALAVRTTDTVTALAAFGVVLLVLVAPAVVAVVAPDSYDRDNLVSVVRLVGLAAMPMPLYLGASHVLLAERSTGTIASSTVFGAVLNIVGNLLLIPVWGLSGAAVATVASYLSWALVLRAVTSRRFGLRWGWTVPLTTGAAAVVSVAATELRGGLTGTAVASCCLLIAGAALVRSLRLDGGVRSWTTASTGRPPPHGRAA